MIDPVPPTPQQPPGAPVAQSPEPYSLYWYNFTTGEYDSLIGAPAPDQVVNYIPTTPGARELFNLYVNHKGMQPLDAMIDVLERVAGVHKAVSA